MSAYSAYNDLELTEFLRSGDHGAFTEIYNRYSGLLYVYVFKLLGDPDGAKDLVQELFISLWNKKADVEFTASLSSYLYSAVRYKFLKLIAHQKVKTEYAERFLLSMQEGISTTDNYMIEKELSRQVEMLVSYLPSKMARIFILSRMEYRSNKEIAAELNLSEKTVKNLMSQALKSLRLKIGLVLLVLWLF
jgi:RNA polymerase sigma-70 factor (ECF subfamily)